MQRYWKTTAALLAAAGAQQATARDYTLLIHETPAQLALRTDPGPRGAAYWVGFAGIGAELAKAGVLKGGAALETPDPRGNAPLLSGYFIIDVADETAARRWAARVPAAATGRVDVRAHAPAKTGM